MRQSPIVSLDHARVEDLLCQIMADALAMARICNSMAQKMDMVVREMREAVATGSVVRDGCADQVRSMRTTP